MPLGRKWFQLRVDECYTIDCAIYSNEKMKSCKASQITHLSSLNRPASTPIHQLMNTNRGAFHHARWPASTLVNHAIIDLKLVANRDI